MSEIWKSIQGYEGLYEISNLGNVRGLKRSVNTWYGKRTIEPRILKQGLLRGYLHVGLSKNNKIKTYQTHRLVAKAFIPNPENKPTVNHLNENKSDNRVENLEWATFKEQSNYGTVKKRISDTQGMEIEAYSFYGGEVLHFVSLHEAQDYGFTESCISDCLRGKQKTHRGYTWKKVARQDRFTEEMV